MLRIDPDGMLDDDYTIYSDGTMRKEETDDNTNTYTYVNKETKEETDLGTYEKVTNENGEEMVKAGDGATGENDIFQWLGITSGNLYFEENAFAGFLGGVQNFYDNVEEDVEKVQVNQFMSSERVHSGSSNRNSALDIAYYNTSGETGAHTTNNNVSLSLNTSLYNSMKKFGLGSSAVYTSTTSTGSTPYISGTTGLAGHHHHFHFDGFKKPTFTINKMGIPIGHQ